MHLWSLQHFQAESLPLGRLGSLSNVRLLLFSHSLVSNSSWSSGFSVLHYLLQFAQTHVH